MRRRVLATSSVVAGQERGADGVRVRPAAARSRRPRGRSASGTPSRMPAPSPESGSAPVGAAVLEVAQRGDRLGDDVVAGLAGQGGDERDTTGVVLVESVVEPLGRRERVHAAIPPVVVAPGVVRLGGRSGALLMQCDAGDDIGPSDREDYSTVTCRSSASETGGSHSGRRPRMGGGSADPGAPDEAAEQRRSGRPPRRPGASAAGRRTTRSGW